MKNKYYVIYWDFGRWNRLHPNGMTLPEANTFAKESNKLCDVIHEMWLDCLTEWFEPTVD